MLINEMGKNHRRNKDFIHLMANKEYVRSRTSKLETILKVLICLKENKKNTDNLLLKYNIYISEIVEFSNR